MIKMDTFDFDSNHDSTIIGSCQIKTNFDARFKSWVTKILPDRLNAIRSNGGTPDFVERMAMLLRSDKERLHKRLMLESYVEDIVTYDIKFEALDYVACKEIEKYYAEIRF